MLHPNAPGSDMIEKPGDDPRRSPRFDVEGQRIDPSRPAIGVIGPPGQWSRLLPV